MRASSASSGFSTSSAEFVAEGIFEAATDGKEQLRYQIGEDAVRWAKMRLEQGDDAFIQGIKERMPLQTAQN